MPNFALAMADNYLEKKMQDRERGLHTAASRPSSRRGVASLPLPLRRVLAMTDRPECPILRAVAAALVAAGCKVALVTAGSDPRRGNECAQRTGARFVPGDATRGLDECEAAWGQADTLLMACNDGGASDAALTAFTRRCAEGSRIINLGDSPLPKPDRAATSNAIATADPSSAATAAVYLLLPLSSLIDGHTLRQ